MEKKNSVYMCADELRPSAGPEARLSSDLGLLAGVAVIVIVLVVAAVCIVALLILWR